MAIGGLGLDKLCCSDTMQTEFKSGLQSTMIAG